MQSSRHPPIKEVPSQLSGLATGKGFGYFLIIITYYRILPLLRESRQTYEAHSGKRSGQDSILWHVASCHTVNADAFAPWPAGLALLSRARCRVVPTATADVIRRIDLCGAAVLAEWNLSNTVVIVIRGNAWKEGCLTYSVWKQASRLLSACRACCKIRRQWTFLQLLLCQTMYMRNVLCFVNGAFNNKVTFCRAFVMVCKRVHCSACYMNVLLCFVKEWGW